MIPACTCTRCRRERHALSRWGAPMPNDAASERVGWAIYTVVTLFVSGFLAAWVR